MVLNSVLGNRIMIEREAICSVVEKTSCLVSWCQVSYYESWQSKVIYFYDDFDFEAYLQFLEEALRYFPIYLHACCLMTNHIHLQIESIHHHPKDRMKMLNSRYAMYLNKRHRLVGHVFQGRYGAELIDSSDFY